MKKFAYFWPVVILVSLFLLGLSYSMTNGTSADSKMINDKNYKFVTQGTCASNNLNDLSLDQCTDYFKSSNYQITGADHGPPGCWLVLGNELTKTIQSNPQLKGKGFGCHSTTKDGKQCSSELPCVCR